MYRFIWHQAFSDYGNLHFKPNDRVEKIAVRQNISGKGIRVEFSNKYDQDTMTIIRAEVATNPKMDNACPITLNGQTEFEIPSGESLWSDCTRITVPLKASLYFELEIANASNDLATSAHNFSNKIFETTITDFGTNYVYGITSIALQTETKGATIAFFGDSLTNQGYYTDSAAEWLYQNFEGTTTINEGISGNRLLLPGTSDSEWRNSFGQPAVVRFSQLINYRPDVVVILIGDNDLYQAGSENKYELPTPIQVKTALTRIVNAALVAGITPILVTLTPFKGALSNGKEAWSQEKEGIRNEINQWIRKKEGMIDLDGFVCDASDPSRLAEHYDSGDHLHFSERGGEKIGSYVAEQLSELVKGRGMTNENDYCVDKDVVSNHECES